MANFVETGTWVDGVYLIPTTVSVKGGNPVELSGEWVDGWANVQGKQLAERTRYLYNQTTDIAADITLIDGRVDTVETSVATAETNISNVITDVSALQSVVSDLGTDVSTLAGDVSTLTTSVSAAQADIGSLQTGVAGLETNVASLTTQGRTPVIAVTVSRDFALTDDYHYLRCSSASPITLTLKPTGMIGWDSDTEITLRNAGVGDVTISEWAGVEAIPPKDGTLVLQQGMTVTLKLVDTLTDTWDVVGQTVPV